MIIDFYHNMIIDSFIPRQILFLKKSESLNLGLTNSQKIIDFPAHNNLIFHSGDFYYLFISWGLCCRGVDSTYSIHYGRSKSPNGPFLDRNQRPMTSGYGSLLYGTNGNEVGPGGQSVVRVGSRDLLVQCDH